MALLQVYGIPTCNTCRAALGWLDGRGIAYEFINTKTAPPSHATIAGWVSTLGDRALRNTSGRSYRALGPERQTWDAAAWVEAFAADAMLLKRPLFVGDGRAIAVGFRPADATAIAALAASIDRLGGGGLA